MKRFISFTVVAVLSSLVFLGCTNTKPPTTSGIGISEMTHGKDFSKHLQVHNAELGKQIAIIDVKSRTTNGLLEINLQLKSAYEKSLKLQYHFNWFDAQGFVIESRKTPWKPLELHGFQSTTLRGLSPNEQAVSFNVYVRRTPEKAYEY
jgi:uncharacterized protein YcfL